MEEKGSVLSYHELIRLVEDGVIEGSAPEYVNASSIDVHLSTGFMVESPTPETSYDGVHRKPIDVAARERIHLLPISLPTVVLGPGEFVLAATREVFHLPDNISAHFVMKSSVARSGLDQLSAAWASAGWTNSALTLELKNVLRYHMLRLTPGMAIGQMVFFRHQSVPADKLYSARGSFNNQRYVAAL